MHITSKRVVALLGPSFLIASSIFLFGPYTIYQGNIDEFVVPLTSILSYFVFPALILVSVISVIGLLLPEKLHQRYTSILFILGILIWLQGNIFVWKYGLLDGQSFDWTKGQWRGLVDGALWIALLIGSYVFYRKLYKIAVFGSIVLVSLQAALLVFSSFQEPEIWKMRSAESSRVPDEIFEFSSKQNVIHIILDAFQSDIFQEIIEEDINYYNDVLEGFTFFKETTSTFPYTFMSIPAILSGQNYKNDIPMRHFIKRTLNGKTIPNALYNAGYDVDLVYFLRLYKTGLFSNSYYIDSYEGIKGEFEQGQCAMMLDLVLFRDAPHFLKKAIYNNQSWMIQRLFFQGDIIQLRPFNHLDFLRHLMGSTRVSKRKPVYKFIHLMAPHIPLVMNKDCGYAGEALPYTRENIKIQSWCTLRCVIEVLEKLKSIGIYDSSLIIIHGDHGNKIAVNGRKSEQKIGEMNFDRLVGVALPLMIIKLPYDHGPLRTSNAQVMLTDIPATISAAVDLKEEFPGRSMFQVVPGHNRERRFYYHDWDQHTWRNSYFEKFTEYIISGSVFERDSWRLGAPTYARALKVEKICFGRDETTFFLNKGWSFNEKLKDGTTCNWALGKSASLLLSLPKNKTVRLAANMKTARFKKPQYIFIKVDGNEVGAWQLYPNWIWEEHSVVIGPDENRPDVSIVEFIFSQHLEKEGKRPLAVLFESLTLSEP